MPNHGRLKQTHLVSLQQDYIFYIYINVNEYSTLVHAYEITISYDCFLNLPKVK